MLARLSALVIWAVVAAALVFWGLRLTVMAPGVPANAVAVGTGAASTGDLTRLLGAAPVATPEAVAQPEAASRFKLVGVMAPKAAATPADHPYGVALIAVDGKPAKAYAVGATLDGSLVLQSVSLRTASIGPAQGAAAMKLEMPAVIPPSTGTLPAYGTPVPSAIPPAAMAPGAFQPPGNRLSRLPLPPPTGDNVPPEIPNGATTE